MGKSKAKRRRIAAKKNERRRRENHRLGIEPHSADDSQQEDTDKNPAENGVKN